METTSCSCGGVCCLYTAVFDQSSPVHSPVHGPVQSPESRFCSVPVDSGYTHQHKLTATLADSGYTHQCKLTATLADSGYTHQHKLTATLADSGYTHQHKLTATLADSGYTYQCKLTATLADSGYTYQCKLTAALAIHKQLALRLILNHACHMMSMLLTTVESRAFLADESFYNFTNKVSFSTSAIVELSS